MTSKDSNSILATVNVRRYDLSETPTVTTEQIELDELLDVNGIKSEIQKRLNLTGNEVIKLRNSDNILLPLSTLLKINTDDKLLFLDITQIHHSVPTTKRNTHLQDAYLDAVKQKVRSMENRIIQAEQLIPQLQWRRQAHMEQTVHNLSNRVTFLNRRMDELMPAQWKNNIPPLSTL